MGVQLQASGRGRRQPVQERSRRTVDRIMRATEELIAAEGVDAVTTRTIAELARVSAPSLYRFFDDRDAILDALLEEMLAELEVVAEEAEGTFGGESIEAFVRLEFELHVSYYERHPSLVRLWFDGRVSPAVVERVRGRNQLLARRAGRVLTEAGLVQAATPALVFDLLIEYGDRTLDVAFRHGPLARPEVIETGIRALSAFLGCYSPQPTRRSAGSDSLRRGERG